MRASNAGTATARMRRFARFAADGGGPTPAVRRRTIARRVAPEGISRRAARARSAPARAGRASADFRGGLVPRRPARGEVNGAGYLLSSAWISSATLSPTNTPPLSSALFQVIPNASRLMVPVSLAARTCLTKRALHRRAQRCIQCDALRDAADGQVTLDLVALAGFRDRHGLERDRGELRSVEEVSTHEVLVALRDASVVSTARDDEHEVRVQPRPNERARTRTAAPRSTVGKIQGRRVRR